MTVVDTNDELLLAFIDESIQSIRTLPDLISDYMANPSRIEAINSVFRTVHSIKGNAGFFGLSAIKKFAHSVENALDDIRNQKLPLRENLNRALIEAFDKLGALLHQVENNACQEELGPAEVHLLERISQLAGTTETSACGESALIAQLAELAQEMSLAGFPESLRWSARLAELMGAASETQTEPEAVGPQLTPEDVLSAQFTLAGEDVSSLVHSVAQAFRWPEDGKWSDPHSMAVLDRLADFSLVCRLRGDTADQARIEAALKDFKVLYESPIGVDQGLLSVVWEQVADVLGRFHASLDEAETPPQRQPQVDEPAAAGDAASQPQNRKARSIRIKEDHLDRFLDDVSSLFITCERLKDLQIRMAASLSVHELVEELRQINTTFANQAGALQKSVVSLRKVPIRSLMSKFPPMARKLATDLGKSIRVHLEGEEIEVDKALIEDLDSPLTHMVRNVADHAIEPPAERAARGVEETGNLWIKAETTRSHVIITVRDDGRGIDPDRIRQKALAKQILPIDQLNAMSDREVIDLIFHPGFSTAEQITDVSGRGVGMDVVRTTIREHEGEIHVESVVNQGTTFTIEMPIRQAVLVIDGLLVAAQHEQFILPFEHIREVLELQQADIKTCHGQPMAVIRGQTVSVVALADQMELAGSLSSTDRSVHQAVLVSCKQGMACLLVDRVLGKRKVVVNDMQTVMENCPRIGGVAQLGGGRLSLVVSVPEIIRGISQAGATPASASP